MAISKHSFASTRYRFTSRQILNYPGDEIPTRSAVRTHASILRILLFSFRWSTKLHGQN